MLGDAAALQPRPGGTLPGICPSRSRWASTPRDDRGRPSAAAPARLQLLGPGQLAVIGRGQAVADIWKLHFGGLLAWLTWIFVHISSDRVPQPSPGAAGVGLVVLHLQPGRRLITERDAGSHRLSSRP